MGRHSDPGMLISLAPSCCSLTSSSRSGHCRPLLWPTHKLGVGTVAPKSLLSPDMLEELPSEARIPSPDRECPSCTSATRSGPQCTYAVEGTLSIACSLARSLCSFLSGGPRHGCGGGGLASIYYELSWTGGLIFRNSTGEPTCRHPQGP